MGVITREQIRGMMTEILVRQGRRAEFQDEADLRDVGFRSLDFSELALRVEAESGRGLEFDGAALREIRTVANVLDFMMSAVGEKGPSGAAG